jgi:hypothetical protein
MGKKYMDTKKGSLESSILDVWQDAVDDLDEKYTERQRNIRDLSRGRSGKGYLGKDAITGKQKNTAAPSILKKASDPVAARGAHSRRKHGGGGDGDESDDHLDARGEKKTKGQKDAARNEKERKERQARLKMQLLKKKQQKERDRERARGSMSGRSTGGDFGASVGVREELDLEILVLEQMIEEIELDEKYTDAQRAAREKARGSAGRETSPAGKEREQDRKYAAKSGKYSTKAAGTFRGERDKEEAKRKLELLRKKRQALSKEREKIAASYEPDVELLDVLDEEILFLTDLIIEEVELDELNLDEFSLQKRQAALDRAKARTDRAHSRGDAYTKLQRKKRGRNPDHQGPYKQHKKLDKEIGDAETAQRRLQKNVDDRSAGMSKDKSDQSKHGFVKGHRRSAEKERRLKLRTGKGGDLGPGNYDRRGGPGGAPAAGAGVKRAETHASKIDRLYKDYRKKGGTDSKSEYMRKQGGRIRRESLELIDILDEQILFLEYLIQEDSVDAITRMDGRTKAYRGHRAKLEAARAKREAKKLDPVGQEDDDVDNDGDTDSSDEYLKKRRKAVSKAVKNEAHEIGTDEYREYLQNLTPGETDPEWVKVRDFKVSSMKEALAKVWGLNEEDPSDEEDEEEEKKTKSKNGKTETGKKAAAVDVNPDLKEKKK